MFGIFYNVLSSHPITDMVSCIRPVSRDIVLVLRVISRFQWAYFDRETRTTAFYTFTATSDLNH